MEKFLGGFRVKTITAPKRLAKPGAKGASGFRLQGQKSKELRNF